MKINKEFAPITITIETIEDKHFILSILDKAKRYYMSDGKYFTFKPTYNDSFMQKCSYLEGQF